MKKLTFVKKTMIQSAFVAFILLFASCTNNQRPDDTTDVAEEHNDAKFVNDRQADDAQFLVNAAEINLEQIQLGQLAQQHGTTTQVKELGKMMEDAHSKSLRDLTALAKSKMITIPTSLTDNTHDNYNILNEKSVNDFDKAYVDMIVSSHKNAIEVFEEASTDSYDTAIKSWATASLTDLRSNLDKAIDYQQNFNEI